MQDPNEDTEWNDILRDHKILPAKEKAITEEQICDIVQQTINAKTNGDNPKSVANRSLDELDELEDEEDERVLRMYREKRIAQMKEQAQRCRFGQVLEITGRDYVQQVNQAGDGVWVVLLLYKPGYTGCALMEQNLQALARKYRATKFLKSVSTTCVPNFPDAHVPSLLVYYEAELMGKFVASDFPKNPDLSAVEKKLSSIGAIECESEKEEEEDRRCNSIRDVLKLDMLKQAC